MERNPSPNQQQDGRCENQKSVVQGEIDECLDHFQLRTGAVTKGAPDGNLFTTLPCSQAEG